MKSMIIRNNDAIQFLSFLLKFYAETIKKNFKKSWMAIKNEEEIQFNLDFQIKHIDDDTFILIIFIFKN